MSDKEALLQTGDDIEKRGIMEKFMLLISLMLLTVFVSSNMVSCDIVGERKLAEDYELKTFKIHSIDTFCNVKHGDALDKKFCLYANEMQQLLGMFVSATRTMRRDFPGLFELMYRTSNLYLLHSYKVEQLLTNRTK
jgi:hypothetical protein